MNRSSLLLGAAVAALLAAVPAQADECPCDCYFSSDCASGQWCNWGSLSVEDSCWWRRPKPQGQVGANCDEDYGDWGQCDGKCTSSAAPNQPGGPGSAIANERPEMILAGIQSWADAFADAGLGGGGAPSGDAVTAIHAMPFNDLNITYGLWRFTSEMLILAAGPDALRPPTADAEHPEYVVRDFSRDEAALRNFRLVIAALAAEIEELGSGRRILDGVELSALDAAMFERICTSSDLRDCLYVRVQDLGQFIGGAWDRAAEGGLAPAGGPSCGGCYGDVDLDDQVAFGDVLAVLSAWGGVGGPYDVDGDGAVGFGDLLSTLSNWGACAP